MSRRITAAVVSLALAGSAAFVPNAVAAPAPQAPIILAADGSEADPYTATLTADQAMIEGIPGLALPGAITITGVENVGENTAKLVLEPTADGKNVTIKKESTELTGVQEGTYKLVLSNGGEAIVKVSADYGPAEEAQEEEKAVDTKTCQLIEVAPGGEATGTIKDLTDADNPHFGPSAHKDGTNFDPGMEAWTWSGRNNAITVYAPEKAAPGTVVSIVTEADRDCLLFKVPGEENSILAALGIGAAAAAILAALGSGSAGSSTGAPAAPADPKPAPAPAPAGPQKGIDPKAAKPAAEGTTQPTATQKGKLANTGTETVLATLAGGVLFAALGAMLIAGRRRSF